MRRNRMEPREIIMYRISLAWEDDAGELRNQEGRLEDRSPSGAGIAARKAIPVGTKVTIQERGQERVGTVRHCTPDEIGYFIGIRYEPQDDKANESLA